MAVTRVKDIGIGAEYTRTYVRIPLDRSYVVLSTQGRVTPKSVTGPPSLPYCWIGVNLSRTIVVSA